MLLTFFVICSNDKNIADTSETALSTDIVKFRRLVETFVFINNAERLLKMEKDAVSELNKLNRKIAHTKISEDTSDISELIDVVKNINVYDENLDRKTVLGEDI